MSGQGVAIGVVIGLALVFLLGKRTNQGIDKRIQGVEDKLKKIQEAEDKLLQAAKKRSTMVEEGQSARSSSSLMS
jgi:F0F1-type ATP synthase membrane subunit b/b'